MSEIFTDLECQLLASLSTRQTRIMNKLASLAGTAVQAHEYSINLESFIGINFDQREVNRIAKLVSGMKEVIEKVRLTHTHIQIYITPDANALFHKIAFQVKEYVPKRNGEKICEAILALKRAFGIPTDVEYQHEFTHESFNSGEDTSCLDTAFLLGERWRISFGDSPDEFINREIYIRSMANDTLGIFQVVTLDWPENDEKAHEMLARVPAGDFTDPDIFHRMLQGIVDNGRAALEKAEENFLSVLSVTISDGSVIRKPVLLKDMKEVCGEKDAMCDLFGSVSEVRRTPEWPLDQEPHGYFREIICDLARFQTFIEKFDYNARWRIEDYIAHLWATLFMKRYGIAHEDFNGEKPNWERKAGELRAQFPERVEAFEKEFQDDLVAGKIRIAWGLYTKDFQSVMAFIAGIISHPELPTLELPHMGWVFPVKMDKNSLRKALKYAYLMALNQEDESDVYDEELTDEEIAQICFDGIVSI